ncbi:hypothetical protein KUTeg_001041 [Tegillarca granosa]|uniref:Uncharacterized protein n=1 Tax=Tegillarca granosa TaxID=220873 RepID=A0ABQ9FW27_TEGGR|nr:hypothetical protein KUTeg_001041 [Tegillarca granosa]
MLIRLYEFIQKLKLVAPELNLGVHSLQSGGAQPHLIEMRGVFRDMVGEGECIVARASWNAQVHVTHEAINEIMNLSVRPLNEIGMDLIEKSDHECVLFCDASSFGYCGHYP